MLRSLQLLLPAACLYTSTACVGLPFETDAREIQDRYAHRWEGECYSWLKSRKTGYAYCASPAFDADPGIDLIAEAANIEEPIPELVDLEHLRGNGERVYNQICIACHQADGKGQAGVFPPLAGAGEFYGDGTQMSGYIINGLSGEISVLGETYNGVMPAQGALLSDYQIAAVATYVRTSFGNDDGIVTPEEVAAAR